jgi:hypothetical protein
MENVTTELDERFSDPGAKPTSWEETERTLREAQLFWISTVRRSGGGGIAHVFAVRPTKVLAFGKGGFSHTRSRTPVGDPLGRQSSRRRPGRRRGSARTRRSPTAGSTDSPQGHVTFPEGDTRSVNRPRCSGNCAPTSCGSWRKRPQAAQARGSLPGEADPGLPDHSYAAKRSHGRRRRANDSQAQRAMKVLQRGICSPARRMSSQPDQ